MSSPPNKTTIFAAVIAIVTAVVTFAGLAYFGLSGERGAGLPVTGGYYLQESASPVMDDVTKVYNVIYYIISAIVAFVLALMVYIMIRFREKANPVPSKTSHNTLIEIIWTVVPIIILVIIAVPSIQLLYKQDVVKDTEVTVKAVGATWSWEYSYPDHENISSFVANALDKTQSKEARKPYLLATDAPLVVPVDTNVKVIVTSVANMHAWTVPSFGIKIDAVPGIINETWFRAKRTGTFYGQCSEICGIDHYKMPIEVEVVSKADYARWVANGGSFDNSLAENSTASATSAAPK